MRMAGECYCTLDMCTGDCIQNGCIFCQKGECCHDAESENRERLKRADDFAEQAVQSLEGRYQYKK